MSELETLYQYETLQRSGRIRMHDRIAVIGMARKNGFMQLAILAKNPDDYAALQNEQTAIDENSYQRWLATQQKAHSIARAILNENTD